MATYVIGDIQGCYKGFTQLLKSIRFRPQKDKLIAVGDIVARGEDSLSVIQYCHDLGERFSMVLGNHDLHLLAIHAGLRKPKASDKLGKLLKHPDIDQYIDWLRSFPLVKTWKKDTLIVHAGLYPMWSFEDAKQASKIINKQLTSKHYVKLLSHMYGNTPDTWSSQLSGMDRSRFIINACTRMRYLTPHLALDFACKTAPASAPDILQPWFQKYNPHLTAQQTVIFGHWASLQGRTDSTQFIATDTGYVWGNKLTAVNLAARKSFHVNA